MKVGSSKVQKTDVRVVAATNVDFDKAIDQGRFREDLYYRLSQVPVHLPPLRQRAGDIHLLFRKFTTDFSEQYRMPPLSLDEEAVEILGNYPWPGNIRQLKNVTEQMSILETGRRIDADTLLGYLPETRHQVDAHAVMAAMLLGQFQFGSDAIGARHQQGISQAAGEAHQPPKTPKASDDLRSVGGFHRRLDALHERTSGFNVNSSALVIHGTNPMH